MNAIDGMNSFAKGMKFRAVADELRRGIESGRWRVGDRLPTERELADLHQVGLNTVRRAVELLATENLVERRQGSGMYVRSRPQRRQPGLVGVVVPSSAYYYPPIIDGISRELAAADVRMMLACSDYDPRAELAEARRLVDAGVDGLLIAPTLFAVPDPAAFLAQLRDLGVPIVLVERRPVDPAPDDSTEYVCSNISAGAYRAVRHLATLGRHRLGHLGRLATATADAVADGFLAAVSDLGLPRLDLAHVRRAEWRGPDLAAFARTCADERLTGVLAHGDRDAAALLAHLRAIGLRVPDDIAVVSYDDEVADVAEIALTAVAPPKGEVGRLAATVLLRRIAQGAAAAPIQIQLQPTLTIRASCGAVRPAQPPLTATTVD